MAAKSKLSQQELRKLMKERQSFLHEKKKISSPLAKYNQANELICIVCNAKVKNELLWTAHINGKVHKENWIKIKKKKSEQDIKTSSKAIPTSKQNNSNLSKEPAEKKNKVTIPAKQLKKNDAKFREPVSVSCTSHPKKGLIINYEEPDDEEDLEDNKESQANKEDNQNSVQNQLPSDFFDKTFPENKTNSENTASTSQGEAQSKKISSAASEALPEGFFDDPIMDAKIRKVEYKDPMDDEWDKFQKAIAEESTVSQALMEEDDEESKALRQIDEIDEQIHNWARVDALQRRKDERINKLDQQSLAENDSSSSSDEFDEFLDWRSKETWH